MIDMSTWEEVQADVIDDLRLDPRNVRLEIPYGVPEADIIHDLFANEKAFNLVEAIAKVGYLTHELPIVVIRDGEMIVVEGNRRVAALKAIQNPFLAPDFQAKIARMIEQIPDRDGLKKISVKVAPSQDEADQLIAALHTGNQRVPWSPSRQIVINDLDPAIYAFWWSVVNEPKEFSNLIERAKLDLTGWSRQKKVYLTSDRGDYMSLGFATFYLNRTNRSGALNGGVIGGLKQLGRYKIDARFNKSTLIERVRLVGIHARRITVLNTDGLNVIAEYADNPACFIYADPPYFDRSGSLYLNAFTMADHSELAARLNGFSHGKWLLTYDDVPRVHELYALRRREPFPLNYSAHLVLTAQEIMIYSDSLRVT